MTDDMDARARVKRLHEKVEALRFDIERHVEIAARESERAQAAESMLEVEREEARHELQRAEAENARLREALELIRRDTSDYAGAGEIAENALHSSDAPAIDPKTEALGREAYPQAYSPAPVDRPEADAASEMWNMRPAPDERKQTGDALSAANEIMGDLADRRGLLDQVDNEAWLEMRDALATILGRHLNASGVPSICPDCRDGSGSEVTGWYYQCDQCGRHWKEVEQDSGVPEDNND